MKKELKELITKRGLRPLGNKKRLLWTEGKECLMYAAIFRDDRNAERYSELFASYAQKNPPPYVVETMVAYAPRTIYHEKFAFICPYPDEDSLAGYEAWAHEAMLTCNDTLRQENYFSGYSYEAVIPNLETILRWDVLLPRGFAFDSPAAQEMLTDPPDGGFKAVKMKDQDSQGHPASPTLRIPGWLSSLISHISWPGRKVKR